jgi:tRNA-specific 2-thiouridylase
MKRGRIVDASGKVLGEHSGTYRYTMGQRRGLGIASSRPYYVIALRPEQGEVVVGRKEELFLEEVEASEFTWVEGFPTRETMEVSAQVRYRHQAAPGLLQVISSDRVKLVFDNPQWAITPGQALVCYEGARVLGGGWITRARNPELSHEEIR